MLYLIRGVPGSGKSTLANAMWFSGMVDHWYEADDFMVDENGDYSFDPSRLTECHAECQRRTLQALLKGRRVAVANTFTRLWEMRPYIGMGFPFTVIRCEGRYPNVHGVTEEKVNQMRERFEDYNLENQTYE